jgi:hypothetical protein
MKDLGSSMAPSPLRGRAQDQVIIFTEGDSIALPVHARSRSNKYGLFFLFAALSTSSVPLTFVSIVRTGLSTIKRTATVAAR